jgi:uncharacterized membrane protein YvbJ
MIMGASVECKSCGNILHNNEQKCPYCGTIVPGQKSLGGKLDDVLGISSASRSSNDSSSPHESTSDSGINWVVMVILIIVFWPAAIIYALVKSKSIKL